MKFSELFSLKKKKKWLKVCLSCDTIYKIIKKEDTMGQKNRKNRDIVINSAMGSLFPFIFVVFSPGF